MHQAVLQKEVLQYLDPKSNENFIDCTFGEGGHAMAILVKNEPDGKLLGIEIDPELYRKVQDRMAELPISNRLILVNDSFSNLKSIIEEYNFRPVQGILFDFGISSWHLEESGRGFSFLRNEPLDMRYGLPLAKISNFQLPISKQITIPKFKNSKQILTAEEIVNNWSQAAIEKILQEYGEEKFADRIAKQIIETRKINPIKTTFQLVDVIKKAIPGRYQRRKIHFATRTFQALRIAVNSELENIKIALPQAAEILEPGGRMVCISFHSLEDRIIKNFFKEEEKRGQLKILTKKPITPSKEEVWQNPRSRSAKLRAAILLKS